MAFIDNLFTWDNFMYLMIFIGLEAIIFYIYENFTSPYKIVKAYFREYLNPELKYSFVGQYGSWAVVTGSTDGIGKAYARELARHGMNIVLISRSENKLIDTAAEIENTFKVETQYIVADFSKSDIYEQIKLNLEGLDIGILVNNVGQSSDGPQEFADLSEQAISDMLIVNVTACTMMTRLVVNQMKRKKRGAIVNVSSSANLCFVPYASIYAATKVYVKYFSKALEWELAPYNITVQLLSPGMIPTNMTKGYSMIHEQNPMAEALPKFIKSAIFTLGKTNETTGCCRHAIQMAFSNLFPMEFNSWVLMTALKRMQLTSNKH